MALTVLTGAANAQTKASEIKPMWSMEVSVHQPGKDTVSIYSASYGEEDERFVSALIAKHGASLRRLKELSHYGPDAGYLEIEIGSSAGYYVLRSWHPIAEKNPRLVATAKGIEPLGRRNKKEVLDAQPADYRLFREVFDDLYHQARTDKK